MLGQVQNWAAINSGSGNLDGLAATANLLADAFSALPGEVTLVEPKPVDRVLSDGTVTTVTHGRHLLMTVRPECRAQLLLTGHMDTVFPADHHFQTLRWLDDGTLNGPGVADMKSGLVLNVFVAEAFARCGGLQAPLHLFFSCDEEIGSPATRDLIMARVRGARAVFNAEPGRVSGNVVTSRKGSMVVEFEVQGVAAHAGINHAAGASAIEALARKTLALHALTDPATGVTCNVGVVQGGIVPNMVAPHARAEVDLRFTADTDPDQLLGRVRAIVEEESVPRTQGRITTTRRTMPMKPTPDDLLALYQQGASALGFEVQGEFTGGAADSGLTASVGVPTLCATGPVGGHPHTEREYCELTTFVPRAQAVALAVLGHP